MQAIRTAVQKFRIIRSYEAQKPRRERERVGIHIQSREAEGTGIALEKPAEHPCLLGKNTEPYVNIAKKNSLLSLGRK